MAHTKGATLKKPKAALVEETEKSEAEIIDISPRKQKISIEIEETDAADLDVEEKTEADLLLEEDEEEAAADEIGLDDEELNPFGDKWEE